MISKEDAGYFVAESCITVILNIASKRCVIIADWYSVLNAFLKEYSFVSQSAKQPNRPSKRSTKLAELNGHRWHGVAVMVEYTVQRFHSSLCGKLNLIQKSSWFIIVTFTLWTSQAFTGHSLSILQKHRQMKMSFLCLSESQNYSRSCTGRSPLLVEKEVKTIPKCITSSVFLQTYL